LSRQYLALERLHFWVKEKNSSTAEIDYLYPYQGKLIPVEVKSGSDGRLKSGGVSNVMLPLQVELPKAPTNRQVVPLVQFGKG